MPGRQPFQFYLCSNSYNQAYDSQPYKSSKGITSILIASILVHIYVQVRIKLYKAKNNSVLPTTQGRVGANLPQNLDDWNLTSIVANACCLLCTGLFLVTIFQVNRLEPSKFNQVKHCRYFVTLVILSGCR